MSFVVILVCLSAQWFLNLTGVPRDFNWAGKYLAFMRAKFSSLTHEHPTFSFLLLVLPPVILLSLVFTFFYHVFGRAGYGVLSLLLLWCCTDIMFLKQSTTTQTSTPDLFLKSYQKIFAPLFWYFIFGPAGLILYVVVAGLYSQLSDQKYFMLAQGVLDWFPVRLLGLGFALAGNFSLVFKAWMKVLFQGVSENQNQVIVFGESAMTSDPDAFNLIRRTVLIWLVVMALITLGSWIG
ncbi:MAG: regulatory signaling modulator protein AmpE [Gammaproteobacteria bacterium]|nr:regulatory signaling modulator protein AmpE [Gammaproteobacteria bacterium]